MKVFQAIVCLMVYVHADHDGGRPDLALDPKGSTNPEIVGMAPDTPFQELLWFFRRDDPSTWNYCILALSVVVLLIGLILLRVNVKANRNRRVMFLNTPTGHGSAQTEDEAEMKPASLPLQDGGNSGAATEDLLPKAQNSGQVLIQWKDGQVTSLFAEEAPEEDA